MTIDVKTLPGLVLGWMKLALAVMACAYVGLALADRLFGLSGFSASAQDVLYVAGAAGVVMWGMK